MTREGGDAMRILIVDAGNYSRSPAAERVLRKMIAEDGIADHVSVWSGGLKDKHAGGPPDPRTVEVCAARGVSLDGFVCREIEPRDFEAADMILAMDRENLRQLEERRPPGNPVRIRLYLGDREVPDPYFGGADGFVAMLDEVERGARAILDELDLGAHAEDSIGY
jgi:protein-tyrosine phosphatase